MLVYLINIRRNLCKFYDSTVEIEYLVTNIVIYFFSNLKIIYHTEDYVGLLQLSEVSMNTLFIHINRGDINCFMTT